MTLRGFETERATKNALEMDWIAIDTRVKE